MAEAFLQNVYIDAYDQVESNYISVFKSYFYWSSLGIFNDIYSIKTDKIYELNYSTIGYKNFSYFQNLKNIEMPNVRTIIGSLFQYCYNLETISLENTYIIGKYTFSMCSKLSSIYIPNIHFIDQYTFYSCNSIKELILDNCHVLDNYAFWYCAGLKQISASNLEYIEASAFAHCSALLSVEFSNLRFIVNRSNGYYLMQFESCIQLETLNVGKVETLHPPLNSANNNIPYRYSYNFAMCYSCSNLKSVTFSKLTEIKNISGLFGNDIIYSNILFEYNFDNLVIAENLYLFLYGRNVSKIYFPKLKIMNNCSTFINYYANSYNKYIDEIYLPELLYISNCRYVFSCPVYSYPKLERRVKKVNFNKLRKITGSSIFENVLFPSIVDFPMLEEISGSAVFYNCRIETFVARRLKSFSTYSSYGADGLMSWVDIPNIEYIGNNTFYGSIYLLGNVTYDKNILNTYELNLSKCSYIGALAFCACTNLEFIEFSNAIYVGQGAFQSCNELKHININKCSILNSNTFRQCSRLAYIECSNIESIYEGAFNGCGTLGAMLCTCDEEGRPNEIEYSGQSSVLVVSPKYSFYYSDSELYSTYRMYIIANYSSDRYWYEATDPYSRLSFNPVYWYKNNMNSMLTFPKCKVFDNPFFYSSSRWSSNTFNSYIHGLNLPECYSFKIQYIDGLDNLSKIYLPKLSNLYSFYVQYISASLYFDEINFGGVSVINRLSNLFSCSSDYSAENLLINNIYFENASLISLSGQITHTTSNRLLARSKKIYMPNLQTIYDITGYVSSDYRWGRYFNNLSITEFINLNSLSTIPSYAQVGFISCYKLSDIKLDNLPFLAYSQLCFVECSSLSILSTPNISMLYVSFYNFQHDLQSYFMYDILKCIFPTNLQKIYLMTSSKVRIVGQSTLDPSEYTRKVGIDFPDISYAGNYLIYYKSSQSLITRSYYHWQDSSGRWRWADLSEYTRIVKRVDFDGHYKYYTTMMDEVFTNPAPYDTSAWSDFIYKRDTMSNQIINAYATDLKYKWLFSISRSVPLEVIVPGSLYFDYLSDSIWMDLMNNYQYINIIAG